MSLVDYATPINTLLPFLIGIFIILGSSIVSFIARIILDGTMPSWIHMVISIINLVTIFGVVGYSLHSLITGFMPIFGG